MAGMFLPTNQKRLTNVCVVRMKKHGDRFEIACYPNKVAAWRSKVEKDLSEVLQANTVFTNVAKGKLAKREELQAAFGTDDQEQIVLEILANGEIQVTEKERQAQADAQLHDVATFVAGQCVQVRPKAPPLPLSVALVEKAMRELHIALRPNRSTKQNGLEVMKKLKASSALEMQRCQMRLQVTVATVSEADSSDGLQVGELRKLRGRLANKFPQPAVKIESEKLEDAGLSIELLCDPGVWHELEEYLREETRGASRTQVLAVKELPVDAPSAADEEPDEEEHEHEKGAAAAGKSGAKGAPAARDQSSDEDEKAERSKRAHDKRGKDKARGEARDHKTAAQLEAASDEEAPRQHKSTKAQHRQQRGDDEDENASGDEHDAKSQPHKEQAPPQPKQPQQQQQQAAKSKKKGKGKQKDDSDEDDAPHGRHGRRRGQRGLEEDA